MTQRVLKLRQDWLACNHILFMLVEAGKMALMTQMVLKLRES